ncbi:Pdx1p [Sporobolomyces salmoneus]|uniref:Pdx1p n=1 Tax=Sporobolomyces salmoneus TaxID=183962 RepID=UPI00317CE515
MLSAVRSARQVARPLSRQIHQSRINAAITEFKLPAMSPTMTEGSVGEWKFKEGEAFSASDVLMTVETDKATVDVEAQDDGILAKIGVAAGTAGIPVGQTIALLAEEGDDISNLEFPPPSSSSSESSASPSESKPSVTESDAPTPSPKTPTTHASAIHAHPTHSKPLLPSVLRQLALAGITDTSEIKATGHKGMLTKGDVLAFLGKIGNPHGSIKKENLHQKHPALEYAASPKDTKPQVQIQLDGPTIRRMIATGLAASTPSQAPPAVVIPFSFDSILDDYLPASQRSSSTSASSPSSASTIPPPPPAKNDFDAFLDL